MFIIEQSIENLVFKSEANYIYFIKQFDSYLSAYINSYCYNLLDDHFHFMIQIKDVTEVKNSHILLNINKPKTTQDIVNHRFKNFYKSYAMAFNK